MKIDLGCGFERIKGFTRIDIFSKYKPDIIMDMSKIPYPFKDNSIEEIHCSHALENAIKSFSDLERVILEWYRISKPNAIWTITLPHWTRAYRGVLHTIGFEPDFLKYFVGGVGLDQFHNLDIKVISKRYNWRTVRSKKGLGKLLLLLRVIWNPILNINTNLTENLLCNSFCGIDEFTIIVKVKKREIK